MMTIDEKKESKHGNDSKVASDFRMPGCRMFNVPDATTTAEDVMHTPFPGYQNPDRWALISCYDTKDKGSTFVKLHGNFNSRKMAENVGRSAMANGYPSKCLVVDTRAWMQFPVPSVETDIFVNEALKSAIGLELRKENEQMDKLRARVDASRTETPTTAFGRYEQLVAKTARELLEKLDTGDEKTIELKKKFETFRAKELAMIQQKPLDPVLANHFKKKIAAASMQDKTKARAMHGGGSMSGPASIGMGMPSFSV